MKPDKTRHRVERRGTPTLRNWDTPKRVKGKQLASEATIDCGWGRLIFAHTFDDNQRLADAICDEKPNQRNIALYIKDPHVVLALKPHDLFLDHELVELAARIPPGHKIDGGGKYVLKEMARKVIPDAVIDRPKGYFPVPELKYLSGRSLQFVKDTLTNQAARDRALFNPDYVNELLDEPHEHMTPLRGSKLWQVAVLEAWLQHHVDGRVS